MLCASHAAIANDWATAPESGTYEAEVYVQAASSGCLDKAGYAFVGSMSYSGLSGTTYTLRALESGNNFAVDSLQTLTVKSGKGTTSPSGSLMWVGAGIGGGWNVNGTFSGTVTEITNHAFVLELKEAYTGCSSETLTIPLARIGVNQ